MNRLLVIIILLLIYLPELTAQKKAAPVDYPEIAAARDYLRRGENAKALELFLGLLNKKEYDLETKSVINLNIGTAYTALSQYNRAELHLREAVRLAILAGSKIYEATAYIELGNLLLRYDRYSDALKEYEKALPLFTSLQNEKGLSLVYSGIGSVYENQGLPFKAMEYHKKGLEIDLKLKDSLSTSVSYGKIAKLYNDIDSFELALRYLQLRLPIAYDLSDYKGLVYTWREIGYSQLNTGKYRDAIAAMDSMIVYIEKSGMRRLRVEAHDYQAQAFEKVGDYQAAAKAAYQAYMLTDSLKSEMEDMYMADIRKLRTEKEECLSRVPEPSVWTPVGRTILILMVFVNLIFIGLSYWVWKNKIRKGIIRNNK